MKSTNQRLRVAERSTPRSPRSAWIAGLTVLCLLLSIAPLAAAPNLQSVNRVYISDVWENGFVVSWTTDVNTDGHVDWGTSTSLGNTTSDAETASTTHYVVLSDLTEDTLYYFQVRSGSTTDDNGGAFYTVTTGVSPSGIPEAGKVVYGHVYDASANPVANAIVYLQLQDNGGGGSAGNSQWVSARTDGDGAWLYSLGNIRVDATYDAYYVSNDGTDNLRLVIQGGSLGCVGESGNLRIETLPSSYPAPFDTTLDNTPTATRLTQLSGANRTGPASFGALAVVLGVLLGLVCSGSRKQDHRA